MFWVKIRNAIYVYYEQESPRRDKFVEIRFIVEKLLQTMNSSEGTYNRSPRRSGFERRPERTGFVVDKVVGWTAV
jgi:hypothetical protein